MLRFCCDSYVSAPCEAVYRAYRDRFAEVAKNAENIERVERTSSRAVDEGLATTSTWYGRGPIPVLARPWVHPRMLLLDDWVTWRDRDLACTWRVESRHFTESGACHGEIQFTPESNGRTRVRMSGQVEVSLAGVRALPRVMRRLIAPQAERFIVELVLPNLQAVAECFDRELKAQTAASTALPLAPPGGEGR